MALAALIDGRWMSPDPLGGDITNPQSLNRYAYALNNPTTLTDPLGLGGCDDMGPQTSNEPWCGSGNTNPGDYCSYLYTNDASCPNPPGLWPNGTPIFSSWPDGEGSTAGGSTTTTSGSATTTSGPTAPPTNRPFLCGDFGTCTAIGNLFTGQVGGSVNVTLPWWGVNFTLFAGIAIDLHGHIALYRGIGGGVAKSVGASASAGVQIGDSNADTVCGLRGPFINASGTVGAEGAGGTIDVFQGSGNGPGGTVTGGTVTVGAAGGASASVSGTYTTVVPLRGKCP